MTVSFDDTFILDSAQRFLDESFSIEQWVSLNKESSANQVKLDYSIDYLQELWRAMIDLEWPKMMASETAGGVGLAPSTVVKLLGLYGEYLVPLPLGQMINSYDFIAQNDKNQTVIQHLDHLLNQGQLFSFEAHALSNNTYVLYLSAVQGRQNNQLLHLSYADNKLTIQLFDMPIVKPKMDPTVAAQAINLTTLTANFVSTLPCDQFQWDKFCLQQRLFYLAELHGLARGALNKTVQFVKERKQFGKTIGGFQAIKHALANDWIAVDDLGLLLNEVAERLHALTSDTLSKVNLMLLMAEERTIQCALNACRHALQFHGAMGMTWETGTHYYLKRAYFWIALIQKEQQKNQQTSMQQIWEQADLLATQN